MKVVTAQEMQEIDRKTIRQFGIPGRVLMERAGLSVAGRVKELFGRKKTIVLAGRGNNGGDGIVAARELFNAGWHVRILFLAGEKELSPDCLFELKIAKRLGVPVEFRAGINEKDLHGALVLDALFGTGLSRNIDGPAAKAIRVLDGFESPVVSVDIPSGISSDTGQVMGAAVNAAYTVTFGLPKRGHLLYPGAAHAGRLFVEDIGFPEVLLASDRLKTESLERGPLSRLVPERPVYSHKGNYGHVLVVAGSRGKTGAAFMSAGASMRTGAGLVTIGAPESLVEALQGRVTEEMTLPLPDTGDGSLSSKATGRILNFLADGADVLCIGPGIGVNEDTRRLIEELVRSSRAPLVIDADGLNSLAEAGARGRGVKGILRKAHAPLILTPHPGEMARLLQGRKDVPGIERDRIDTAVKFSKETGTYLILKGVPTVIAEPSGRAFLNSTGNPGMATAGAGDVLTGIIGALLAQGLNPLDAAKLGPYLHGLAGDLAAGETGTASLVASDLISALPAAFRAMTEA
ncbi:MAG: NAD(P)H-hydrate dehydratase [Nitrospirae bacterium]|nr:NAD(P)H-hydrate dehydratase [Nitrospirota bacterium]